MCFVNPIMRWCLRILELSAPFALNGRDATMVGSAPGFFVRAKTVGGESRFCIQQVVLPSDAGTVWGLYTTANRNARGVVSCTRRRRSD
jgi:hypothetical protein